MEEVYRERLWVPVRWWLMAALIVGTLFVTVAVAIPLTFAVSLTVGVAACLTLGLWTYGGGVLVRVTTSNGGGLTAHRARIEAHHLGAIEELDAEQARRLAGRDADPNAYLLLRPYAQGAVRIEIVDPRDPTPYWLVSTRHPSRLANALCGITSVERG